MQKLLIAVTAICFVIGCSTQNPNPNNNGNNTNNVTYTQGPNVSDFDGNVYPSVTNCNQTWTAKNLNVSHYRNGDVIPQVTDSAQWANLTTGAWCYYNNDPAMGVVYGKLYNWYAVNDSRGLAPTGWHVPTDGEWNKLVKCIDNNTDTSTVGWQNSTAGGAMKETGTTHWITPNTGATNSSGYYGLPGGIRSENGQYNLISNRGYWWTSTETNATDAWYRPLHNFTTDIPRNYSYKRCGFSLRLVKD